MTGRVAATAAAVLLLAACTESESATDNAQLCSANQLKAERLHQSAANGTYVRVWLRNTSSQSCELRGYPRFVRGLSAEGRLLSRFDEGSGTIDNPRPGRLPPDGVGVIVFFLSDACSEGIARSSRYDNVTVGVPGGGSLPVPDLRIEGSCEPGVSSFGVRDGGGATFETEPGLSRP